MIDATGLMKFCNACKTNKPLDQFGKDKWDRSGYTNYCKKCRNERARFRERKNGSYNRRNEKHKEYRRQYYKRPEVLDRLRDQWFKKNYGISIEDYYDILNRQDGKCAICETEAGEERIKRLVVDHDHETKKIRELLCHTCNRALGLLKDNVSILEKAIRYLRKWKEKK